MARYIDVGKINFKGADRYFDENNDTLVSLGEVMQIIKSTPAADVVEVVRCKDCIYCDPDNKHCDHAMGTTLPVSRKENDFCSYGERKDGE